MAEIAEDVWELVGSHSKRWVPIVEFGKPLLVLGLMDDGAWAWRTDHREELFRLDGPGAVGALPLLEMSMFAIEELVESRFQSIGLRLGALEALPTDLIYEVALSTGSSYWIDCALSWMLEHLPVTLSAAELRDVSSDTRIEQSVRHRLLRLAKRLEQVGQTGGGSAPFVE